MDECSASEEKKECPNQDITSLVEKMIVHSLLKLKDLSNEKDKKYNEQLKLIFPKYRDKAYKEKPPEKGIKNNRFIRYSEQEARFLFCREIEYLSFNKNSKNDDCYSNIDKNLAYSIFYSVETPTENVYLFKYDTKEDENADVENRAKPSSGSIDVCIHDNGFRRNNCLEFKCSNVVQSSIQKDFEKLIMESGDNFFIHLFKTYDCKTIEKVIEKYKNSFDKLVKKVENNEKQKIIINANSLTMYICIIEGKGNESIILRLKINFDSNAKINKIVNVTNGSSLPTDNKDIKNYIDLQYNNIEGTNSTKWKRIYKKVKKGQSNEPKLNTSQRAV